MSLYLHDPAYEDKVKDYLLESNSGINLKEDVVDLDIGHGLNLSK